jgi:hypothetical protein
MNTVAMIRRSLCSALAVCAFTTATFIERTAKSQPTTSLNPEAVAFFNEARALMRDGKFAKACPKLEKARQLGNGIGISFNLADCYENIGRTASAWAVFQDTAAAAQSAGQTDRAQVARQRASSLEPKLSKLRIVVSSEAAATEGIEIQRSGIPVSRLIWDKDVPVDPGRYAVSATAPGRSPWTTTVLVDKPGGLVEVRVPALASTQTQALTNTRDAPHNGQRSSEAGPVDPIWFVVGGATALVGLGLGVGMTVAANGKSSDAEALRATVGGSSGCASPGPEFAGTCTELADAVKTRDTLSNVAVGGFVTGGALALGTAGLFVYSLMKPSSSDEERAPPTAASVRIVPVVGAAHRGLSIVGSW